MKFEAKQEVICIAEKDDECLMCNIFDYCPLIIALRMGVVHPSAETITIEGCPLCDKADASEG